MIESFQEICKECRYIAEALRPLLRPRNEFRADLRHIVSVRVTILGGDVHLAALGRFYSNPALNIPCENDHRYMANVVSSAIVNKPPPQAIANLLARRNKIHHLNPETDETLLKLFNKDPGDSNRTAAHNQVTMPSRNFAMLTENSPHNPPRPPTPDADPQQQQYLQPQQQTGPDHRPVTAPTNTNGTDGRPPATADTNGHASATGASSIRTRRSSIRSSRHLHHHRSSSKHNGRLPIHAGEAGCGTHHRAARDADHGRGNDGSLDICIRVEIDQHDAEGRTEGYGLTVPALVVPPTA